MAALSANSRLLRQITIDAVAQLPATPTQKIRTDEDLVVWRATTGYRDFAIFLQRLNEAVVGHMLPWTLSSSSQAILSTLSLLETLDKWIDEIPPLPTPQRFGNLAFRAWGRRLEEEHEALLTTLLPAHMHAAVPHLAPYILTSFGSFTRMDYGTGHETSFALFLLCLTLIRFFDAEPEVERDLVLIVFVRYLRLCWRLQDVYRLEPAGSHGVWGLDDYSFLGYIFGSAQLRDQADIPVSAIIHHPLPPTNLYFLSISRILEVKQGPFFEHSSQLYSIATGVPHWSKVNSGLFKMYDAEVLGKRVVVQHLPLGGLVDWDPPIAHATGPSATAAPTEASVRTSSTNTRAPSGSPPTGSFSTISDPRMTVPRSSAVQPRSSHSYVQPAFNSVPVSRMQAGPLVAQRMLLGPLASSSLRPTQYTAAGKSTIPGPTTVNTPPPSSATDQEATTE